MLGLMLGQIACKPRTPQPVASAQPRIAALAPAYTQMLRELRREHQLIARHAYDQWAPPSVPSAGDQAGIDYEALLRLRPTHVLIQRGAGGVPAQLATLASANGWHVTALPLLTLADVEAACAEVNTLLAGPEHPPIALPLVGPATGPIYTGRVLLLYQLAPPIALGPGSYHHDMLMRVGGTSALAIPPRTPAAGIGATAFMTLDSEDLIRLDPDAIILIRPRDATAAAPEAHSTTLADVAAALARLNLRAARPGEAEEGVHPPRIAIIDDPVALIPGPGLRQVGAQIEAILTSWAAPTKVPASPPKNQP
jgi:ABC-type hemin transport system substrate-binding protein